MSRTTTSLRLDDELRERLAIRADVERTTVSALIQRYVHEGLAMDEHPGIFFKRGYSGRRAALVGGADVWTIASALRRFSGTETERIRGLAEEFGIHEHQIVVALNYIAANREEIDAEVRANDRGFEQGERLEAARKRLLA